MAVDVARRRRKDERPAEILDAAFEEFAARGFAGTRLDDVAARAGITKGTIYVYFASKEDLFCAMVKEMCRPANDHLSKVLEAPAGQAIAILREHLAMVFDLLTHDRRGREVLRMMIAEAGRFPDLADRWYDEILAESLAGLQRILAYGCSRGEFRDSAVAQFPQLLMASVLTASNWVNLFADRRRLDLPAYFEAAIDLLVNGLAPRSDGLIAPALA